MLNRVLGYGQTPKEIGKLLTKGRYGLMGLHNTFVWLVACGGIDSGLLEGKLSVLNDAVLTR